MQNPAMVTPETTPWPVLSDSPWFPLAFVGELMDPALHDACRRIPMSFSPIGDDGGSRKKSRRGSDSPAGELVEIAYRRISVADLGEGDLGALNHEPQRAVAARTEIYEQNQWKATGKRGRHDGEVVGVS